MARLPASCVQAGPGTGSRAPVGQQLAQSWLESDTVNWHYQTEISGHNTISYTVQAHTSPDTNLHHQDIPGRFCLSWPCRPVCGKELCCASEKWRDLPVTADPWLGELRHTSSSLPTTGCVVSKTGVLHSCSRPSYYCWQVKPFHSFRLMLKPKPVNYNWLLVRGSLYDSNSTVLHRMSLSTLSQFTFSILQFTCVALSSCSMWRRIF